jgi:N-acyl amino acid synthase of PEP-CTERM/exosortase system
MSMRAPMGGEAATSRGDREDHGSVALFRRHLTVAEANSAALLDRVFRLRYQVYCIERGFENAAHYPDGRERDRDDGRSSHFLVLDRATGSAMGTVRLILPRPDDDLPVFRLLGSSGAGFALPQRTTAEVSRFAVAKASRRRLEEVWRRGGGRRTALPLVTFGLIEAVVMMSAIGGITHIVAMMEPALLRLLRRLGIEFHPIGSLVEHHGLRQPGWAAMAPLVDRVKECRRDLWELATDAGRRPLSAPRPATA